MLCWVLSQFYDTKNAYVLHYTNTPKPEIDCFCFWDFFAFSIKCQCYLEKYTNDIIIYFFDNSMNNEEFFQSIIRLLTDIWEYLKSIKRARLLLSILICIGSLRFININVGEIQGWDEGIFALSLHRL